MQNSKTDSVDQGWDLNDVYFPSTLDEAEEGNMEVTVIKMSAQQIPYYFLLVALQ